MNSVMFQNTFEIFQYFFTIMKIPFSTKIQNYDRETFTQKRITQQSFECDMKPYYNNISKICNVLLIFQNFEFFFYKRKRKKKN